MTTDIVDVKAALTEGLTELRLPTVKRIYEESARFAERDTLSYERYLLDLVTRESQDRQQKRIGRLLRAPRNSSSKSTGPLQPETDTAEGSALNQGTNQRRRAATACKRTGIRQPRAEKRHTPRPGWPA